tara:strand:+ start:593 stop:841 length:249 start_codon:yes stop_codon:yes gene_type:complete
MVDIQGLETALNNLGQKIIFAPREYDLAITYNELPIDMTKEDLDSLCLSYIGEEFTQYESEVIFAGIPGYYKAIFKITSNVR